MDLGLEDLIRRIQMDSTRGVATQARIYGNSQVPCLVWHVRTTNPQSLWLAWELLCHRPAQEFTIVMISDTWIMRETFADPHAARERIEEACLSLRQTNVMRLSRFRSQKVSPLHEDCSRLAHVVRSWQKHRGEISNVFLTSLEELSLLDRAIILKHDERDDSLRYAYIGDGFRNRCGKSWPEEALGTRCDREQPDYDYTNWTASHYRTVFQHDEARRDLIDCIIQDAESQSYFSRVQYDRVVLPARLANGRPALISVSEVAPGLLPLIP
ncbi:MAG: hypothetical protein AAF530_08900 [Pseudomonadota bacterium]